MKQAAIVVAMLGLTAFALAQQPTGTAGNAPAQTNQAPASASQTNPGASSATPAATTPKRLPQAKTQPEFDAYQAAMGKSNDPDALEKAADDFASKFPDSELRILLYRAAMHAYQAANNADKMLDMGRKTLAIDPDDPEALVGVAEVLVERTRDTDMDKQQRWDEAGKDAQRALTTVDTDLTIPPNTPQDKVDAYKGFLRSSIYSILGTLQFNQEKYADAEANFHKSIDAYPSQPDPVVVLRLALALDKQNKYADALKFADQAVDLSQNNAAVAEPAKRERDRLIQLTGGIPMPSGSQPAGSTPPATSTPPAGSTQPQTPPK
jgi:tetratricopeptide (TPR) repeat protein